MARPRLKNPLSKLLQIRLSEKEYKELKRISKKHRKTMSGTIRYALQRLKEGDAEPFKEEPHD